MTTNRLMGVGTFIVMSVLLFGIGLFMIGDRRMLFSRKFEVYTEFKALSGLEVGAPVWVSGLKAGEVGGIDVPPGPPSRFRVRLKIRRDLKPLVRKDSVASIQTEGLVGNVFLQVSTGSPHAAEADSDSTIPSRDPVMFGEVVQQMSDTIQTVHQTIKSVQGDIQRTVESVGNAADTAENLLSNVQSDVKGAGLRQTLDNARKATASLAEDVEALKHNFFLRGFFKDRGYFDLESISAVDYRHGALLSKDRTMLRVWLPADSLFRDAGRGAEVLTDKGKARVDSAMGELVPYRGEGPLIVEGYSMASTADQQYIVSRRRAEIVRAYLIEKFGLDRRSTGQMALGSQAPDAVKAEVSDGVALALYAEKRVVEREKKLMAREKRK